LAKQLFDAMKQQGSSDPVTRQLGTNTILSMKQIPGAEEALAIMQPMEVAVLAKASDILNKPHYMPEFRSGQYNVVWKENNQAGRVGFDTKQKALNYMEGLQKRGITEVTIKDKFDEKTQSYGIDPITLKHNIAIQTAGYEAAVKLLGQTHPQLANIKDFLHYDPAEVALSEFGKKGLGQFFQPRKLALGREELDFASNTIDYIQRLSTGLAKRFARDQVSLALMDPDLVANPKLLDLARKHFNHVINPTGQEWSKLKQMNFAYFMAYNPASILMESSQGLMTLVPQLTRDTGSIAKSYALWGHGVKTSVAAMLNKGKFADPILDKYFQRAVDEGRIDFGTLQEIRIGEENVIPNLGNIVHGGLGTMSTLDLVKKPLFWYLNSARWLYGNATKANSAVAFVTFFEHARKTMTTEQAYQRAVERTYQTMFGGGAAARPIGMFDLLHGSKASGAMGVLYSLGTYTYSTIAMMARLGKEGILRNGNIPASEKNAALKAFGQMAMTQVALGGALSLPFTGATMALLEQMFPDANIKQGVKDTLAGMFTDDEEMGGLIADCALKGAPTRFMGVDLSSRVALSNILGVSSYDGFSLPNLLGPSGAVFNGLVTGANQLASGNSGEALKSLMPVPYKNVIDLYNNQGAMRDKSGNLIYDPTRKEKILYALGLRPTAVTSFREAQRNVERMEASKTRENANFFGQLANQMQQGDTAGVREALNQKHAEDPMFDPVAGGRRVVEELEKRLYPIDLARTGSLAGASDRQRVQNQLQDRGLPTETERVQTKIALGQQLGLPPVQSRLQLNMASMVDHIRTMNPTLSRQEAVKMVEQMFGHQQKTL